MHIVICAFQAELLGINEGLKVAWMKGIHFLVVESDSKAILACIGVGNRGNPTNRLVGRI